MKKICLLLALLSLSCLLISCGGTETLQEEPSATPTVEAQGEETPEAQVPETVAPAEKPAAKPQNTAAAPKEPAAAPSTEPEPIQSLAPSTNKEVVEDESKTDVYWDLSSIAYHLKGCPEAKGAQKIEWDSVKLIGLRQCPECNPPRYEGYVE